MIQHRRPRINNPPQSPPIPPEIRYQNLNPRFRHHFPNAPDTFRKNPRSPIRQIIPVHRRYNAIPQTHRPHRFRQPRRLLQIQPQWTPRSNRAVMTPPGANIPQNHKSSRPPPPALPDIRTMRLLANRMQLLATHQLLQLHIPRPPRHLHLKPIRKPRPQFRPIIRLSHQSPQSLQRTKIAQRGRADARPASFPYGAKPKSTAGTTDYR